MRTRPHYYKLIGRLPVPIDDVHEWWRSLEGSRIVHQDHVGPLLVSTVFLGLDHNYGFHGDAILFETMIFGAHEAHEMRETYCDRYATWDEAERGHQRALEHARAVVAKADAALNVKEE